MIAPNRQTEETAPLHGMHRARHMVARMLLERSRAERREPGQVAAWKGWLWAGWVAVVGAAYAAHVVGWL
jgi:hypothetical protein